MKKKVVIGLSGGIDSTMAALMLKQQGFDVTGLHFSFIEEKYNETFEKISEQLDIPVVNVNIHDDFDVVKQYFANEYLQSRTPSPCTFCNKVIKWQKLNKFADENNCDFISSGHYIRKEEINGYYYLKKAVDPVKDQSYFMWELDSATIKRMINPLGEFTKDEVREIAKQNNFAYLLKKKESMGVCFLQKTDYREFLSKYIPDEILKIKPGIVKDEANNVIGSHDGYINYTIGQKKGMNLTESRAAYISKINKEENEITIGAKESLNHYHIQLKNIHLINPESILENSEVTVNIRGLGLNPEGLARVIRKEEDTIELELANPAWAVAPGQPVVFYNKDIVLGGGIAENSW